MRSLSANAERFLQWRTIDGIQLDHLGQFNELQTLVRGALAPRSCSTMCATLCCSRTVIPHKPSL